MIADGYSVERTKPAPDLFLWAAEQLGVPPAYCAVVEDAEAGIDAALAAGMWAIGLGPQERVGHAHCASTAWRASPWPAVLAGLEDAAWTVAEAAFDPASAAAQGDDLHGRQRRLVPARRAGGGLSGRHAGLLRPPRLGRHAGQLHRAGQHPALDRRGRVDRRRAPAAGPRPGQRAIAASSTCAAACSAAASAGSRSRAARWWRCTSSASPAWPTRTRLWCERRYRCSQGEADRAAARRRRRPRGEHRPAALAAHRSGAEPRTRLGCTCAPAPPDMIWLWRQPWPSQRRCAGHGRGERRRRPAGRGAPRQAGGRPEPDAGQVRGHCARPGCGRSGRGGVDSKAQAAAAAGYAALRAANDAAWAKRLGRTWTW